MATKRRIRAASLANLTPYLRKVLMGTVGEGPPGPGEKVEAFLSRKATVAEQRKKLREIWFEYRKEILRQWKAEGRKGRPWGARFDKKEKVD